MSYTTRFNGDYNITAIDTLGNVQANMHTLIVNGNLQVLGSVANISSTNTQVVDRFMTLNQGETGAGVSGTYAGIEIDRGSAQKVSLRWSELVGGRWEIQQADGSFVTIATGTSGIHSVSEDPAPVLGGDLDTQSYAIKSTTLQGVKFDTNLAIKNTAVTPATLSGYNIVYSQTPDLGQSGLYITNTTIQQQELITKRKAVFYSLMM